MIKWKEDSKFRDCKVRIRLILLLFRESHGTRISILASHL